jgi:protein TonB
MMLGTISENRFTWIGQGISLTLHLGILFLGGAVIYQQAQYGVEVGEGGSAGGGEPEALIAEVELEEPEVVEEVVPEPEPEPEPEIMPEDVPPVEPKPEPAEVKPEPKKENPPAKPEPAVRSSGQANNKPAAAGSGGARVTVKPRYLRNPPPRYPSSARRAGKQGTVVLSVDISTRGSAEAVRISRSSGHPELDRAALTAVKRWRFQPATLGGVKVPSRARVPVIFRLN